MLYMFYHISIPKVTSPKNNSGHYGHSGVDTDFFRVSEEWWRVSDCPAIFLRGTSHGIHTRHIQKSNSENVKQTKNIKNFSWEDEYMVSMLYRSTMIYTKTVQLKQEKNMY